MRWAARVFGIGRSAGTRRSAVLLIGVATAVALTTGVRSESKRPGPAVFRGGDGPGRVSAVSAAAPPKSAAPATAREVSPPPATAPPAVALSTSPPPAPVLSAAGKRRIPLSGLDATGSLRCDVYAAERPNTGPDGESALDDFRENPRRFCWALRPVLAEPSSLLRLVDRDHGLDPAYIPPDLVDLAETHPEIPLRNGDERLTVRAADALADMVHAAERDGIELLVSSAYRDYETQRRLHEYWIDRLGRSMAEALSAPAGHSQHQLGTTVDFAPVGRRFSETPQAEWLKQHAWRYGFSLSYPEGYETITGYNYEPWHYRYIGFAAAYLEREFFSSLQHEMLAFLHANARNRDSGTVQLNRGGPR